MGDLAPGKASVRLAELLGALSLGIDLGFGQPMEHVLRQCLIATRLATAMGLDTETRRAAFYTALLQNVGCHTDAHEQAKWFGDDIELKSTKYTHGLHGPRSAVAGLARLGSGADKMAHRLRVGLEYAVSGHRDLDGMIEHHAKMAWQLGKDLGLPAETLDALHSGYEQWDGKGWPGLLARDEIPVPCRLAVIGEFAEVSHRVGGTPAVLELVRRQRAKTFDPAMADLLAEKVQTVAGDFDRIDPWAAVMEAEPAPAVVFTGERLDEALLAVADFVDLKSPYLLGHSRAVADLAAAAGPGAGLSPDDVPLLRRAALVHGFGRLGVSNAILDKTTPLGAGERERLQMVPFVTQRMLRQSRALAPLGAVAAQYGERLDGSGHPSGLAGSAISRPARVLGAADAYQSLREPRGYRAALSSEEAVSQLRREVTAGRLDADAVAAVLAAAGHRTGRKTTGPAGLTSREVEVLRLLARGLTNRDIADRLVISRKTAANHVEHIYAKLGTSTRAAAALFATKHGLLADDAAG